jgi:hypothetical protein
MAEDAHSSMKFDSWKQKLKRQLHAEQFFFALNGIRFVKKKGVNQVLAFTSTL